KVVIEDWQCLQILRDHRRRVTVVIGCGEILIGVGTDHYVGGSRCDGKHDAENRSQLDRSLAGDGRCGGCRNRDRRAGSFESSLRDDERVRAGMWSDYLKAAVRS